MIDPNWIGAIVGTLALLGVGVQVIGKRVPTKDQQYEALITDRTELRNQIDRMDKELQMLRTDYWTMKAQHYQLQTELSECNEKHDDMSRKHDESQREIDTLKAQILRLTEGGLT